MSELQQGWVDAHTHVHAGLAGWGPPGASFPERLQEGPRRLQRALDEDSLRAAARSYVAEALLQGTTALIDHHESPGFVEGSLDVVADACQELGMRAVVCYAATERDGGREEARRGLAECRRFFRSNARPLVRGVVGLDASFALSDDTIREAGELALRLGTVVHVHVAEDLHDMYDALRRGYESPLSRLAGLGGLPQGSILAQGVHLSAEAVRAAGERELWIVQCPRSNARNGGAHSSVLGESERVALGSDGFPSDPVEETEALLRVAATREESLERPAARVRAGERILAERFGPGTAHKAFVGLGSITVGDRPVVCEGRLVTGDLDEIRARAAEAAPRLWARMAAG